MKNNTMSYLQGYIEVDFFSNKFLTSLAKFSEELRTIPTSVYVSSVFINILSLALPLSILQIYDRVIPNQSYDTLVFICASLLVIIIVEAVLKIARAYLLSHKASRDAFISEVALIKDFLQTPSSDVEKTPSTVWLGRLESYVQHNQYYSGQLRLLLIDFPFALIFLGLIGLIGGFLILVPIILILGFMMFSFNKGHKIKELIHEQIKENSKKYDFITEVLSGIHTVKTIAMEPQMERRFERLQKSSAHISYELISSSGILLAISNIANLLAITSIIALGAFLVIEDQLTIGALACCTLLSGRIMKPVVQGISSWTEIQNMFALKERIQPLHDLQKKSQLNSVNNQEIIKCHGSVTIKNLNYNISDNEGWILKNINLSIAPGELICFRGPNESGKTTLLRCIIGDLQDCTGEIYIDGYYNIKWGYEKIKNKISYVYSNIAGHYGTILENITMFQPDYELDEIHRITQMIGLDEQINRLPEGYNTIIGGYNEHILPTGFIQQLAIARALLNKPSIFILDEVTNGLTQKEKKAVYQALQKIKGSITIIIATNDAEIMNICDDIVFFDKGQLVSKSTKPHAIEEQAI
ncbi:MAG: ABC transporter transmembrane domain-containing protein [Pseudomonadota bacterium]